MPKTKVKKDERTKIALVKKTYFKSKYPKKKSAKEIKQKESKKNSLGPPTNVADFSINWKNFLKTQNEEGNRKTKEVVSKANKVQKNNSADKHAKQRKKRNLNVENKEQLNGIFNREKAIWFDDVDENLLEKECGFKMNTKNIDKKQAKSSSVKSQIDDKESEREECKQSLEDVNITHYVALDCEMVGIGREGKENALARVSLVNSLGECIYDKFVKPIEKVVDYRTDVSGIRPENLKNALDYETVQKEVADILKGRILVGHALQNDLKVLLLSHSRRQIRDTSKYKPFRALLKTKRPALKKLAAKVVGKQIQSGEHSSVVDARVTMEIYQKYKKEWEHSLRMKGRNETDEQKTVFMGDQEEKKKRKSNKWTKIKQRKKKENSEL
ncbi:uncharacterized protein LOC130636368 [Hydractinia symbiolongicarpus]|uniref:uncharacterized protein LOC130636368 n=1 Tax=Hydractinia symbiolongicarpus TaxID=13093 RepID=UPI0025515007|nr:uncharacterized protein LOC130636368 [Hydractinia symbiolongicarpus]